MGELDGYSFNGKRPAENKKQKTIDKKQQKHSRNGLRSSLSRKYFIGGRK